MTILEINKQVRAVKKTFRRYYKKPWHYSYNSTARLLHIGRFSPTNIDLNPLRGEAERMSKVMILTCPKLEPLQETFINPQREIDRKYRYKYAQNRKK